MEKTEYKKDSSYKIRYTQTDKQAWADVGIKSVKLGSKEFSPLIENGDRLSNTFADVDRFGTVISKEEYDK